MNIHYGHDVEILTTFCGRCEGQAVMFLALRPHPEDNLVSVSMFLDQVQCVRLRDTIDRFLADENSYLFLAGRPGSPKTSGGGT